MTLKFKLSMDEVMFDQSGGLVYKDGSPIPIGVELNRAKADDTRWLSGDGTGKVTLQPTTDPAYPACLCAEIAAGLPEGTRFEFNVYPQMVGITNELYFLAKLKVDPSYHFDPAIAEPWHEFVDIASEYLENVDSVYLPVWSEAWERQQLTLTGRISTASGGNSNLWQINTPRQLPIGAWFDFAAYVLRDRTAGKIKVWINGVLIFDISNVETSNLNPSFFTSLMKLYGGPLPKIMYIKAFEIHDSIPGSTPAAQYMLDVWTALGGTTVPTGISTVASGTVVSILASAAQGYKFNGWQVQTGMLQAVVTYPETVNPLVLTINESTIVMPLFVLLPIVPTCPAGYHLDVALNVCVPDATTPPTTPSASLGARSIGPFGVPSALLHQFWRLRERVIRPEVHEKLHPLV